MISFQYIKPWDIVHLWHFFYKSPGLNLLWEFIIIHVMKAICILLYSNIIVHKCSAAFLNMGHNHILNNRGTVVRTLLDV